MPGLTRWNTASKDVLERIADALEKLNDTIDDLEETINFSTVALLTDDSETTLRVKWKKLRDGAQIPVRKGAAYDLFLPQDVEISPGETVRIHLGFACAIPEGYFAVIASRSSTWDRWGFLQTNGIGIVDWGFRGEKDELQLSVWFPKENAIKDNIYPLRIPAGTRLAQFLLLPEIQFEFEEVDSLEDESRGGFGSTGL